MIISTPSIGLLQVGENSFNTGFGTLFSQSTWPNLTHWVQVGPSGSGTGADYAVNSNRLQTYHGINSLGTFFYYDNYYTRLENWSVTSTCNIFANPATDSYGIGIGIGDITPGRRCSINVDCTIANQGVCNLYGYKQSDSSQILLATGGGNTILASDVFIITLTRTTNTLTGTVQNVTQGWTTTLTFTTDLIYNSGTNGFASSGRFFINQLGGVFFTTNISATSISNSNSDIAIVGNSKGFGSYAGSLGARVFNLLQTAFPYKRFINLSGGGDDVSDEMIWGINEMISARAKKVLFMSVADNDIRHGYSAGTWQTAYSSLVSAVQTYGGLDYHCVLPENSSGGVDTTALKTFILATYNNSRYIDTWTAMGGYNNGATYIVADNIHPNIVAQSLIATTITPYI